VWDEVMDKVVDKVLGPPHGGYFSVPPSQTLNH
jgi:hypothetical protein